MPVPPAVPLSELLDALDRASSFPTGRVRDAITTRHPLQPFDQRNFTPGALRTDGPFSFDPIGYDAAAAGAISQTPPPPLLAEPLPAAPAGDVPLVDLLRLLEHPARGFLRQRLDVAVTRATDELEDALPVELDDLQKYSAAERFLSDRLRGTSAEECRRRELRRGALPSGQLGDSSLDDAEKRAEQVLAASALEREHERESYDVDVPLLEGTRLLGTVTGVRGSVLLSTTCASLSARHRLHAWIQLVALSAAHPDTEWTAAAVGRSGKAIGRSVQGPLAHDVALDLLAQLVGLYRAGLRSPLPLPVKTSAEYAFLRDRGRSVELARKLAAKKWNDDRYPGEASDGEHVLLHGADATLDMLMEQVPHDGETYVGEDDRFGVLARRLWQPLLDHEASVVI